MSDSLYSEENPVRVHWSLEGLLVATVGGLVGQEGLAVTDILDKSDIPLGCGYDGAEV